MDHEHSRRPGDLAGDGVPDGPADHPGEERVEERPEPDHGWVGWLLVVAAALPVLVLAEATRQVFTGAPDDWMNGYAGDGSQLTPDISVPFRLRFGFWLAQVPAAPSLLAATLGVVVVTGLVLLARPAWLVPPRPARWAAAGVAALVALAALATGAGVLVTASSTADDAGQAITYYGPGTGLVELGPDVATLVLTAVVAALCGVVLLRPGAPVLAGASQTGVEGAEVAEPAEGSELAGAGETPRTGPVEAPAPARTAPREVSGTGETGEIRETRETVEAPGIPRLARADLDLYRRPAP